MSTTVVTNRCRLVLTLNVERHLELDNIAHLAKIGDIASIILYKGEGDFACQQKQAGALVEIFQAQGVAVMIAGDSQMAGRLKADGLHIENKIDDIDITHRQHRAKMLFGVGGIKSRHEAMEIGEHDPDYVMFGKLGGDKKAAPHPRNLALGTWWASMVEIPCIVQAGADVESLGFVVQTGAEFVALEEAIFAAPDMEQALIRANEILDTCRSITGGAAQ